MLRPLYDSPKIRMLTSWKFKYCFTLFFTRKGRTNFENQIPNNVDHGFIDLRKVKTSNEFYKPSAMGHYTLGARWSTVLDGKLYRNDDAVYEQMQMAGSLTNTLYRIEGKLCPGIDQLYTVTNQGIPFARRYTSLIKMEKFFSNFNSKKHCCYKRV